MCFYLPCLAKMTWGGSYESQSDRHELDIRVSSTCSDLVLQSCLDIQECGLAELLEHCSVSWNAGMYSACKERCDNSLRLPQCAVHTAWLVTWDRFAECPVPMHSFHSLKRAVAISHRLLQRSVRWSTWSDKNGTRYIQELRPCWFPSSFHNLCKSHCEAIRFKEKKTLTEP